MNGLLVICLCAEWCGTCRDYHPEFEALGINFPQHHFLWIDIEDQADLVSDIDIENFPTLLVANGDRILFAGTMQPHIGHLRRLLLALDENTEPQLGKLSIKEFDLFRALVARIAKEMT